jgi:hypothetical protein
VPACAESGIDEEPSPLGFEDVEDLPQQHWHVRRLWLFKVFRLPSPV